MASSLVFSHVSRTLRDSGCSESPIKACPQDRASLHFRCERRTALPNSPASLRLLFFDLVRARFELWTKLHTRRVRSRTYTHKSRLVSGWSTSFLPPEADIRRRIEHVC